MNIINGARGRSRTGTVLPPRDFKSLASTSFATRADGLFYIKDLVISNNGYVMWSQRNRRATNKNYRRTYIKEEMEAVNGIEPPYTALQAAA